MTNGKIDGIPVLVVKEEPKYAITITEHNVERGVNIGDHMRPQLVTLNLEIIVDELDGGDPAGALAHFKGIHEKPIPVRCECPLDIYDPVGMTAFEPVPEAKMGGALHARLAFKQWNVVNTRIAAVQKTAAQVKKGQAKTEAASKAPAQGSALKEAGIGNAVRAGFNAVRSFINQPPGVR